MAAYVIKSAQWSKDWRMPNVRYSFRGSRKRLFSLPGRLTAAAKMGLYLPAFLTLLANVEAGESANPPINLNAAWYTKADQNPYIQKQDNLGQCTWFAYGRIQEKGLFQRIAGQGAFAFANAAQWLDHASKHEFETGPDPRVGAIAVWRSYGEKDTQGYGHVAVVESIVGGEVQATESHILLNLDNPGRGADHVVAVAASTLHSEPNEGDREKAKVNFPETFKVDERTKDGKWLFLQSDDGAVQGWAKAENFVGIKLQPSPYALKAKPDAYIYLTKRGNGDGSPSPTPTQAPQGGEVIPLPSPHITYIFTPGKLTGKEFWLEQSFWREFRFEPFLPSKKPKDGFAVVRFALRGYSPYNIFGHDEFEPKEPKEVASGWIPLSSGHFLIFPDLSKEHLPKFIPEKTKLIPVPFIKQYGDKVMNGYDLPLALDRVNKGEIENIPFQLIPAVEAKDGIRLVPTQPLKDGVYYAYCLPDDTVKYHGLVHGLLFGVGTPRVTAPNLLSLFGLPGMETKTSTPAVIVPEPSVKPLFVDAKLAREVMDYALLSQAVYKTEYTLVNEWVELPCQEPMKNSFIDVESGFSVQAFQNGNEIAIAFRGTEILSAADWKADVQNFFNVKPEQYQQALDFVGGMIQAAPTGTHIVLTGHSLGGGLASYAALYHGKEAIVFNAAGLGSGLRSNIPVENLGKQRSLVRNIDLQGDPVSWLGRQVGAIYTLKIPPSLIGEGWVVDAKRLVAGPAAAVNPDILGEASPTTATPIEPHFIENVLKALQALLK